MGRIRNQPNQGGSFHIDGFKWILFKLGPRMTRCREGSIRKTNAPPPHHKARL